MSNTQSIHPATTLGPLFLTISDLDRSLDFYQYQLGLQLINRDYDEAYLGVIDRVLVILKEDPAACTSPYNTGLYHFAIRVSSRLDLAKSLQRLASTKTPVQGFADHIVSEAVYLSDPDDIGIEIYRDRPREQWRYVNGQLEMATDPLDLDGILAELNGQPADLAGLNPQTTIGHIHLNVADISSAEAFYRDIIGFDLTMRYGSTASFMAAGGYHHHIGINTWAGVGLPPPRAHTTGLRWFTIQFHGNLALGRAVNRIRASEILLEKHDDGWLVRDPSANCILLTTKNDNR